jgi:very-short-patch-repair endonuclease
MDAPRRTRTFAKRLRQEMSLPEVLLWLGLKARRLEGLHFRKQHPIGPYVLDFYCDESKLAVEVDGETHDFGDRPRLDRVRDDWMAKQGIRTLRLPAVEVLACWRAPHDPFGSAALPPPALGATSPRGGGSKATPR